MALSAEAIQVLRDLNPWWADPKVVRPEPPPYRRPLVVELLRRLQRPKGLIEVVRGPRQVGKTTGIQQIIQDLIRQGVPSSDRPGTSDDLDQSLGPLEPAEQFDHQRPPVGGRLGPNHLGIGPPRVQVSQDLYRL